MKFVKYQGLGNDFIITDEELTDEQVISLCDRNFGIGADGVIVNRKVDGIPYMHFYNRDASIATMCGNGIRCYADYLRKRGEKFDKILTPSGLKEIEYVDSKYKVFMNKASIGFIDKEIYGKDFTFVNTGTGHAVTFVDEIDRTFLDEYAVSMEDMLDIFTEGTNINLVKVIDRDNIEILTHEKGVGITLACGTGACATAFVANLKNFTNKNCSVRVLGGILNIELKDEGIYMIGPAQEVFTGEIEL